MKSFRPAGIRDLNFFSCWYVHLKGLSFITFFFLECRTLLFHKAFQGYCISCSCLWNWWYNSQRSFGSCAFKYPLQTSFWYRYVVCDRWVMFICPIWSGYCFKFLYIFILWFVLCLCSTEPTVDSNVDCSEDCLLASPGCFRYRLAQFWLYSTSTISWLKPSFCEDLLLVRLRLIVSHIRLPSALYYIS